MTDTYQPMILVGLDIGTTKIVTIIGQVLPEGNIEIIGMGCQPSSGMKKGVVVNIEAMSAAIEKAVEQAELMAGCEINSVFVGISGSHIRSQNSHGIVAIRDKEVSHYDIERVIDAAQAVAIPADQKILHVLPQAYLIDESEGIHEPLGMSGVRLESRVHIVTCAENAAQNIEKCVKRCGLHIEELILEQLASADAVLTSDEKELGVCLIDIGGGTTDYAVFNQGAVFHSCVLPIAGNQVTNDIAMALRTPTQDAEEIKCKFGFALAKLANHEDLIKVPSVGHRPPRNISTRALAEVIEPRFEELFLYILEDIKKQGLYDGLATGIVLTGGSANMHGCALLAEEVFNLPVRVGLPLDIQSNDNSVFDPAYATSVGLLKHGTEQLDQLGQFDQSRRVGILKMFEKIKGWVAGASH